MFQSFFKEVLEPAIAQAVTKAVQDTIMQQNTERIDVATAAKILGVSKKTIYRYCKEGPEETALTLECDTVMVDNIGYLCNNMDKGNEAGSFMQKLKALKIKHDWNLLIIAHTSKRSLSSPITRKDP